MDGFVDPNDVKRVGQRHESGREGGRGLHKRYVEGAWKKMAGNANSSNIVDLVDFNNCSI